MTDEPDDPLKAFTAEQLAVLRVLARATGHGDDLRSYLIACSWDDLPHRWGHA